VRILILDDNVLRAMDLEFLIQDAFTAEVVVADHIEGARAEEPFDVAVLGRWAGSCCTFDFARELRSAGTTIAYISAGTRDRIPADLNRHFIGAPCTPDEIVGIVRRMLTE
jgi:hypothetical protein